MTTTDENVRRLEQIHSTEAAAATTHHGVSPASRDNDDDDARVKSNTGDGADSSQSGVSSWTRDDVRRWLADNQLSSLNNW